MAYTSIIPVRRLDRAVAYVQNKEKTARSRNSASSLEEAIGYAMNRDKTERDIFETGICCNTDTVFADMKTCKTRWHKPEGVQGYHMVQSFAAGETTPEQAHQIGLELAERLLGGKYQAVVTTHLNTEHLHNHIVWNSVALDTGAKYRSNAKSYYTEVRQISDELCRKYGLSVIKTPAAEKGKSYAEWQAENTGQPTWRTAIREDVDAALARAFTWQQFIRALESQGYEVRMNRKHPTLRPPGKERATGLRSVGPQLSGSETGERSKAAPRGGSHRPSGFAKQTGGRSDRQAVRFKTLGKRYTPEALRLRILYPNNRMIPAGKDNPPTIRYGRLRGKRPTRRLTGLRALYYRYLYELGAMPRKPPHQSYAVRQDIRKLDETVRQMEFLSTNSIDTLEQLTAYRQPIQQQIEQASAERQRLYRHAGDPAEIAVLTARLKALRREDKLCQKIALRSAEMQKQLQQNREQQQAQRQREQERSAKPLLHYTL